jgi:hypothetical protein
MAENRNDTRYRLTDTGLRENEIARLKLEKDVAQFLKNGGKVQQIPYGATALNPVGPSPAFVINRDQAQAIKQHWKEESYANTKKK